MYNYLYNKGGRALCSCTTTCTTRGGLLGELYNYLYKKWPLIVTVGPEQLK